MPVLFDSGVRSGADIVKALALGATAVGDRPALRLRPGARRRRRHRARAAVAAGRGRPDHGGRRLSIAARSDAGRAAARHLSRRAPVCDGRRVEAILDEFDEYLALERGRSDHTRRAYLGDLRSLFEFRRRAGARRRADQPEPADAAVVAGGPGRRRAPPAPRWRAAPRRSRRSPRGRRDEGCWPSDPATRLQVPKARRTLPAVLRQDQALDAMAAAEIRCAAR